MGWRDNLRKASFRGAEFWVDSHDHFGGRRVVTHQYPFRNTPYPEDLGKQAVTYSITAYIAERSNNADYMAARDALVGACEQDGPGELVHPFLGTVNVQCISYTQGEEKTRGGVAFFTLNFVEAGENTFPSGAVNMGARMVSAATSARGISLQNALSKFRIAGQPDFVVGQIRSVFDVLSSVIDRTTSKAISKNESAYINGAIQVYKSAIEKDSTFADNAGAIGLIDTLVASVAESFETPHEKYRQFDGTYRRAADDKSNIRGGPIAAISINVLLSIVDGMRNITIISGGTPMRDTICASQTAAKELTNELCMIHAARLAPFIDWKTFDDAMDSREKIMRELESLSMTTTNDDVFRELTDMRSIVSECVPSPGSQLPSIVITTTQQTWPGLRFAYDEYDDAYKMDEIITMNSIRHPGFIPAQSQLRMLANG